MEIGRLELTNFRGYTKQAFRFSARTVILVGPNGAGKTNFLEAIELLATGKSFRAELEEEMIEQGKELGRVRGEVREVGKVPASPAGGSEVSKESGEGSKVLEVVLTRGEVAGSAFAGSYGEMKEKVGRKKFLVNGVSKRMLDFVGQFRAVLFGPWDLDLITDSPSLRRRYLDSILVQVDKEYHRALLSYEKGLRQRNRLLERIREEGVSRSQLIFWDKLLIKNGDYLTRKREEYLGFLNLYQPLSEVGMRFATIYERSAISESRLSQYAEEEVAAGVTLVGPHRDDVRFMIEGRGETRDLSKFGSRGEQRLAVLWLKLGELEYISSLGERPVLLLDDIFSELDHEHRSWVISMMGKQQTFITTADEHQVEGLAKGGEVIRL